MKKTSLFAVLLSCSFACCFSQNFVIYDSKDYIKPSWLDPQKMGLDSIRKIHYLTFLGGAGFNLASIEVDNVFPNKYVSNAWLGSSFYTKDIQVNLKNSFLFGANYKKKTEKYDGFNNFSPKLQIACYPFKYGGSYLGEQLRLQITWSNSFDKASAEANSKYTSGLSLDYGGYITPTTFKTIFPKTALVVYYTKGIQTNFSSAYGLNLFSGILAFNKTKISNTLYLQLNYNRQVWDGLDMSNFFRVGLVDELIYNKTKNYAVYFFINHTNDYYSPLSKIENSENTKILNLGIFFYFPLYTKAYYK